MKRIGDLAIPRIASLYAQVPADRLEEFQTFRRTFPYKNVTHEGVTWPYLIGGQGDPPLLLLSGALAIPDISWTSIVNFAVPVSRRPMRLACYPEGVIFGTDAMPLRGTTKDENG